MSEEADQTIGVSAGDDIEMSSVDSGYTGSRDSTTSASTLNVNMKSEPDDSTPTSSSSEQTVRMPEEAGQTLGVDAGAEMEMSSVDSGYTGSRDSTTSASTLSSDVKSESGDSTTTFRMPEEAGQTLGVDAGAEMEMSSVDSGYTGSRDSTTSASTLSLDVKSESGDSTTTLVESEQAPVSPAIKQEQLESDYMTSATNVTESRVSGQGCASNLTMTNVAKVGKDPTARTEKWVEESFEVFVKNLDGKTHTIKVEKFEDVSVFRQKVTTKLGVPGEQQRLTSQEGKTLQDGRSLCDYNIKEHSTVFCQGRLRGG